MTEAATAPSNSAATLQHPVRLMPMLTDNDRELIKNLQVLGIPRTAASCLVAITRYGDGQQITGYWLDRISDLRQPEVSKGTQWLIREGILRIAREDKSSRKGRPVKVFALTGKVLQKETEIHNGIATVRILWPEAY